MKLRIVTSVAAATVLAFSLAACKQQMATTELDENTTAPANATAPTEPANPTERVADQGATAPAATPDSGIGYSQSICDAKALRRNEVCNPRAAGPRT